MNTDTIITITLTGFVILMTIAFVILNKSSNNLIKDQMKTLLDQRELIEKLTNAHNANLNLITAQNEFIAVSKNSITKLNGIIDKYANLIHKIKVQSVINQEQVWDTFKKSYLQIEKLKEDPNTDSSLIGYLDSQFWSHASMLPEDKRDFSVEENPYRNIIL